MPRRHTHTHTIDRREVECWGKAIGVVSAIIIIGIEIVTTGLVSRPKHHHTLAVRPDCLYLIYVNGGEKHWRQGVVEGNVH